MEKPKIEYININEIKPYDANPRIISDEAVDKVANSIKEFGFKNPILIDNDGVIIAGHTRRLASIKLGLDVVPVIRCSDLEPEQVKALRLADNKTGEFSEWDEGILNCELSNLKDFYDMSDFGFDDILEDVEGGV